MRFDAFHINIEQAHKSVDFCIYLQIIVPLTKFVVKCEINYSDLLHRYH